MPGAETWWRDEGALERFVGDLVAGELSRLRPGAVLPPRPWPLEVDLTGGALACDSLELLALATALAEAVEMHRSGIEDYLLARRTLAEWCAIAAAALERFSSNLMFRTSGSTGACKALQHPLAALLQEVAALAALLPGRRRVVSAVPAHHIYGFLFTVLLPQRLGVGVVDVRASSPAGLGAVLREGDLVVGHPGFWGGFARTVRQMPGDVVGVSSTAPCPRETARDAVACGLSRLVEVYGASETAGIGWRDDPGGPFELFGHWRRGVEADTLVRSGPDGACAAAQVPDRLVWVGERGFRVEGRRDAAVQVGGINVFPALVRERLLQHPGVRDAAVRLMSPGEGARLKAFIAPADPCFDTAELRSGLTAWCAAGLSAPERPKAFSFGAELPRNGLRKPADWPVLQDAS